MSVLMNVPKEEKDILKLVHEARHNAEAFGRLYDLYYPRIYLFLYRRLGDVQESYDLTATVFFEALKGIRTYDQKKGSFTAWLFSIAKRKLASYLRSKYRRPVVSLSRLLHISSEASEGESTDRIETAIDVRAVLSRLSRNDQDVIGLVFFADLSQEEVAQILGCSVDNVYVRLHRALNRFELESGKTERRRERKWLKQEVTEKTS